MVKVFVLIVWASGAGAEMKSPPYYDIREECESWGERFVAAESNGYEDYACAELEITQPE